jgi:hypothetical protein
VIQSEHQITWEKQEAPRGDPSQRDAGIETRRGKNAEWVDGKQNLVGPIVLRESQGTGTEGLPSYGEVTKSARDRLKRVMAREVCV